MDESTRDPARSDVLDEGLLDDGVLDENGMPESAVPDNNPLTSRRGRIAAMVVFVGGFGLWLAFIGLPTDVVQIVAWLWVLTIAWNFGAGWRTHMQFLRDWWGPVAFLLVYLYSRGLADELIPLPVHVTEPIVFDEWLGGGTTPTRHLQDWLCEQPCSLDSPPQWYDVVFTTVYFTHFIAGLSIAVVLWLMTRTEWVRWMRRYLAISFGALVIYILYPMAPPWMASQDGYLADEVVRLTGRGWSDMGLGGFHLVLANVGNPVAAMPSLHAGLAALIAFYGVQRLRTSWRWVLLLYPLVMSFTLVYYAEHYVIDIIGGFALALAVMIGCDAWERRRGERTRYSSVKGPSSTSAGSTSAGSTSAGSA
ncbi:phosphatase PAP2 family protein [Mumia sp. zg.B21]|uniref:phosphatase PAP2 family protein n=1 Tax=Mumia sp. zg.B21 TaxID=2855447 RepID=UPI001C6E5C03|nr:phosphatase PAP2 family protein [Mumia sp. zg.B21]MBW9210131.1 phosphatase PAP2 family protein [Mumia sp. zg.B21]